MADEDLLRSYRRWQAAEADGRDDEADAEFKTVFAAVPPAGVTAGFPTRTMDAVSAAGARDRRRARRLRIATIAAGAAGVAVAGYFGAAVAVTVISVTFTRAFDLLIGVVVRMAGAAQTGSDLWSVLGGMGRAAFAFAADPKVTMMLFALQGVAVAALIALQRLLGADEEPLQ